MIRNLKMLGMAFAAMLALTAVAASAASAAEFHLEKANAELVAEQATANVFEVPGAGKVECTTAKFVGIYTATTTTSTTLKPAYSGCKAFGFATAHVIIGTCHFTLTIGAETNGPVHIVCPGEPIKITPTTLGASVCTMTIGTQTPGGVVDYTNQGVGTSRDVLATSTVTGIAHSKACGATGENDGKYTGSFTAKGFVGGVQIGIWVS